MQARWNGTVLAESDETVVIEGNHYFPPDSIREELFTGSQLRTVCPWKGVASYYTVTVNGQEYENAAWCYRRPFPLARRIKEYVAFWPGVEIVNRGD